MINAIRYPTRLSVFGIFTLIQALLIIPAVVIFRMCEAKKSSVFSSIALFGKSQKTTSDLSLGVKNVTKDGGLI